ncbi:hypothetical protein Pan44_18940 [Caulifigura coniformis]|uniref:Uncharacterized protein n=1 Tax=Caulifigura coniformis TaxID=2527983 RepID=A0A517SCL5_9PLAN|nr:hypothetical protein [Caulifigura coniformis]QDT53868.1 hypothetical protein Pan44_18940 [Caulifigura coniformis]
MRKHAVLIGTLLGSLGSAICFFAGLYLGEQRALQHFEHALRAREPVSRVVPASFESAGNARPTQFRNRGGRLSAVDGSD